MHIGFVITRSGKVPAMENLKQMQNDLNSMLEKKDYGDGLKQILIGIKCNEPQFQQFFKQEEAKYTEGPKKNGDYIDEKMLEFDVILDYEKLSNLSLEDGSLVIAEELTKALVLNYETFQKKIKNFDFERFRKDFDRTLTDMEFIATIHTANPDFDPFVNWHASHKKVEKIDSKLSQTEQLNTFINRRKFTKNDSSPAFSDQHLASALSELMDNMAKDFARIHDSTKSEFEYQEAIKYGLEAFEPYRHAFDSEDEDLVCRYVEELMDIVELESSGGHVNEWRYGFDPTKLKPE
ncbi:DUF4844 domain-containing protein [uncultured Pedobacter sp.]|uniref:DUF4844 domain-containing protein n=1 Tax=uncultured Pedobacter sp. TaxID=246139 RepID=UPI002611806F|nr:DUF4844 domain-containing protein [uncultured Pedobacter sp.]